MMPKHNRIIYEARRNVFEIQLNIRGVESINAFILLKCVYICLSTIIVSHPSFTDDEHHIATCFS